MPLRLVTDQGDEKARRDEVAGMTIPGSRQTISAPGATLSAWTAGHGEPAVLLVHGGGVDSRIWDEVLDSLATRFRVGRYDRRGTGLSRDALPGDHVRDMLAVREALFGESPTWLVGSSLGASIAMAAALRGAPAGLFLESPAFADLAADGDSRRTALFEAAASGPEALVNSWLADECLAPRRPAGRELLTAAITANTTLFTHPRDDVCVVPGSADIRRLTDERIPVVVLAGERDAAESRHRYASAVSAGGGRLVTVPEAGHLVHLDSPDRFVAELTAAIDAQDACSG
jgi:pimeloyl-ACP methyl ester carboxylesterase